MWACQRANFHLCQKDQGQTHVLPLILFEVPVIILLPGYSTPGRLLRSRRRSTCERSTRRFWWGLATVGSGTQSSCPLSIARAMRIRFAWVFAPKASAAALLIVIRSSADTQ